MDPNHDRVYLRFLFRQGKKKLPTQSLYESFESLLGELGIQLEFTNGEDGIQDITRNVDARSGFEATIQSTGNETPPKPTRRASFHSYNDNVVTRAKISRAHSRDSSVRPHDRPMLSPTERPATRASTRPSEKTHERLPAPPSSAILGRQTAQDYASHSQDHERRNGIAPGNSNKRYKAISGPSGALKTPSVDVVSPNDESTIATSPEQSENEPTESPAQLPFILDQREFLYRPSGTQLLRDAETFQHYHFRAIARDIIKKWCSAALRAEENHKEMEASALRYDTSILLHQGFEQWRTRFHERRQVTEKKRVLDILEQQTSRRRDLFLLLKAFTHWAERTKEEALRTSAARRHVLRLRYFKAWRQITAVNDLKVRNQGLRKFYAIWKQRHIGNQIHEANSASNYEESLLKKIYWRWFWTLCERRAPQWRASQLKAKYFNLWLESVRHIAQIEHQMSKSVIERTRKIVLLLWLKKTRMTLSSFEMAALSSDLRITARSLLEWKLGWQHAPIAREVSNMVDWRIASTTFATLVTRYRVERQSESVNRLRTLRNAWTQWNDRLRWQAIAQQIGDRFMHEALYKWVIAARSAQQQRLHERILKQRMLLKVACRFSGMRAQSDRRSQTIIHGRKRTALGSTFETWRRRLGAHRENDQTALKFYTPRIAHEALQSWQTRSAHIRKLKGWVEKSEYYFMATKFLKRWRAAVIKSKRDKCRDAYAKLRRKFKMDLATEVISRWRSLTIQVLKVDKEAQLIYQNRLLQFGGGLIEIWRTRWLAAAGQSRVADDYYLRRVADRYLNVWQERLWSHQELGEQAEQYAQLQTRKFSLGWLRKLRVQMIELQGHPRKADSLREMYEKRFIQNIVKRWRAETAIKRGYSQPDMIFSARSKRFTLRTEEDMTNRAENWTAFEEDFDLGDLITAPESSTAPLPAYLTTPFKRAATAKAVVKGSTTPAGTPLQRHVRSQPGTRPRARRQGGLGSSIAFDAIVEHDPKTPSPMPNLNNDREND